MMYPSWSHLQLDAILRWTDCLTCCRLVEGAELTVKQIKDVTKGLHSHHILQHQEDESQLYQGFGPSVLYIPQLVSPSHSGDSLCEWKSKDKLLTLNEVFSAAQSLK